MGTDSGTYWISTERSLLVELSDGRVLAGSDARVGPRRPGDGRPHPRQPARHPRVALPALNTPGLNILCTVAAADPDTRLA